MKVHVLRVSTYICFTDGFDNKSSSGHISKANIGMYNDVHRDACVSSKLEDEVASRATQIVQVISEENMCLRKQLEKYYQEIKKLKCVSNAFIISVDTEFGYIITIYNCSLM